MAILIALVATFVTLVTAETYHIVPRDANCPTPTDDESFLVTPTDLTPLDRNESCFTLTEYAQLLSVQSATIDSNITLLFVPGHHFLETRLQIRNVENLTIQFSHTDKRIPTATIVSCTNATGFDFEDISEITLSGIVFSDCRENSVRSVDHLRMKESRFQDGHGLELRSVENATFEMSVFTNLTAFGPLSPSHEINQPVSGGAIIGIDSDLFVTECLFEYNTADRHGGAIYKHSGNLTIHQSIFNANTAGSDGGAIWSWNGGISIDGGIFSSNEAGEHGGAIRARNSDIMILGSNFSSNTAGGNAGAIDTYSGCISINSSDFKSNTADSLGGALKTENGSITIHDSNFNSNTATIENGGAIWTESGDVTVHVSNFGSNTAGYQGGAIDTYSGSITINSSDFIRNTADSLGGALRTESGSITIYDSNFSSNTAVIENGGAIETWNGGITVHSSNFSSNVAGIGGGAIFSGQGSINVHDTSFIGNTAYYDAGAICTGTNMASNIRGCIFSRNTADYDGGALLFTGSDRFYLYGNSFSDNYGGGGAINFFRGHIHVHDNDFSNNRAARGGAIRTEFGDISIFVSSFASNSAWQDGGAIWSFGDGDITIHGSNFNSNTADKGGAIDTFLSERGTVSIHGSNFNDNVADRSGGAIWTYKSVRIHDCIFDSNRVGKSGGALFLEKAGDSANIINNCIFNRNNAGTQGGAIYVQSRTLNFNGLLQITNKLAMTGVVFALQSTLLISGNTTISDNKASLYAFNSNITFNGFTYLFNNTHKHDTHIEEGGAVTAFQSEIVFFGTVTIVNNTIDYLGGAIFSSESKIYTNAYTTIAHNTALSGGGIYAYQSELNFEGRTLISENVGAIIKGGGIYAVGSSIKLNEGQHEFIANKAEKGGAICLELNAKLYVIKTVAEYDQQTSLKVYFTNNFANYGGALYISDDTNSGTCAVDTDFSTSSECFFQDLALYEISSKTLNIQNTFFANNSASVSGGTIFGGLLDRCTVSVYAQIFKKFVFDDATTLDVISYISNITDLQDNEIQSEISSQQVRVCFCTRGLPDCNHPSLPYAVRKGETFKISLVAVDHVRNPIPSSVRAVLSSNSGGLAEGQDLQNTASSCTELNFTITTPHDSELLQLYADGPCSDIGISLSYVNVTFLPCNCPIGFIGPTTQSNCICECDTCLSGHITGCSIGNSSVQRNGGVWITYINQTDDDFVEDDQNMCPYLIHPHCPFDYCSPSPIWIDLNTVNGSDAQCAFNRAGKLCGSCKNSLSVTLGSSHCSPCSNYWLALIIVFALAGVILVTFLLVCNLTVAVGTINGLIFYANVLTTNRSTFFTFQSPNFFTIFIAWLNLDFGFVTCFFDGMDGYIKEWLQLAFPIYIIFLVTMVIIACEYSTRIAKLFTHRNPVATLATLVLLSYAKSLRVIIAALSFATLDYPDGSRETVWLIDGNVHYFKGKHIPLFLAAILILFVGIAYTSLLFSYQWLLRCPNRRALKWIKDARFFPFMDAYLAPYNLKHRYWTGLLLMIRAFLYIVAAVNVSGDPSNNLLSIIITLVCLLLLRLLLPGRIYKSRSLDILEISFIANLILFSGCSLYIRGTGAGNQEVLAYTSTAIAFITFLVILIYHTYTFVLPKKVTQNKLGSFKLNQLFTKKEKNAPEIIHMSKDLITHSVVDGKPSHQEIECAATNKSEVDSEAAELDVEPITAKTTVTNISDSLVSEQTTSQSNKIIVSKQIETEMSKAGKQSEEPQLSTFADIRLYPYIRDSDQLGRERENEMNDCFEL